MQQRSIWILAAALLAAAGVIALVFNDAPAIGLAMVAIAAMFVIIGVTQRGGRSKTN